MDGILDGTILINLLNYLIPQTKDNIVIQPLIVKM